MTEEIEQPTLMELVRKIGPDGNIDDIAAVLRAFNHVDASELAQLPSEDRKSFEEQLDAEVWALLLDDHPTDNPQ